MALYFIKPNEPIPVNKITMMVYGQPSSGKTTFGMSGLGYKDHVTQSEMHTLLIDLESGTGGKNKERAKGNTTVLKLDRWADIMSLTREHLEPFGIIIIDTVMAMQEMMIGELEPKCFNKTGGLTQQGYGALSSMAQAFMTRLNSFNLNFNLVYLAHSKEEKSNDSTIVRPDITGGLKQALMRKVDFIGYTRIIGEETNAKYILSFNPYESIMCKNRGGLHEEIVLDKSYTLLADTITKAIKYMNELSEEQLEQMKAIETIREKIVDATSALEFTMILDEHRQEITSDKQLYQFWLTNATEYCEVKKENGKSVLVDKEVPADDEPTDNEVKVATA